MLILRFALDAEKNCNQPFFEQYDSTFVKRGPPCLTKVELFRFSFCFFSEFSPTACRGIFLFSEETPT